MRKPALKTKVYGRECVHTVPRTERTFWGLYKEISQGKGIERAARA